MPETSLNPIAPFTAFRQQGVFCGGRAGVDLIQTLIYAGYAQRFGNFSLGIAPILAFRSFSAYGLSAFGAFGLSSNPSAVDRPLADLFGWWRLARGALYHVNAQFSRRRLGFDADLEHQVHQL